MAVLALSRDMLDDYAKLQKPIQASVQKLADMFQKMTAQQLRDSKGIHLEPYQGQLDERARTVRVGDNHRGIVLDAGDDQTYILVRVGTHEQVDRWMVSHQFKVNEATGALEILNLDAIEGAVKRSFEKSPAATESALFDHRKDKDFTQLGINESLVPALRVLTEEDQLMGLLEVVPQGQADALIMLTGDDTVEAIYAHVAGSITPEDVDPSDIAAAVHNPASRTQFHVVADESELQEMLAQPLAKWRTYLHQSQESAAYRPVYNGPARITGGAGTGKTVVAMHRANFLALRLEDRTNKPILFTTFTRNLASSIERDLRSLGGTELLDVVEVINVDSLAHRIVQSAEGAQPGVAVPETMRSMWQDVVDESGLAFSPEFLSAEFEQVILAQECHSRSDYFTVNRAGRGVRLSRKQRADVWKAIEQVTQELAEPRRTHLPAARGRRRGLSRQPDREALPPRHRRRGARPPRGAMAAAPSRSRRGLERHVPRRRCHQRIYDRRTSLSQVGINIVGSITSAPHQLPHDP